MADDPPPPLDPPACAEEAIQPTTRAPLRPPLPHLDFLTAILWCILFLIVAQVLPAIGVLIVAFLVTVFRTGGILPAFDLIGSLESIELIRVLLIPLVATSQIVAVLFPLVLIRLAIGRDWARQIALRVPRALHVLLTALSLPALMILAAGATVVAKRYLPSLGLSALDPAQGNDKPLMQQMVEMFGQWPLWISVPLIGVCPGIGEELFCRGFLGRGLVGRYGIVGGVLLTSFLFGAIHVDPQQGTMAALMGVVLHYVYLTTRSLWCPILLHFLNNSVAVAAMHFGSELAVLDTAPETISPAIYAAAVVVLIGIGWALYATRARLVGADGGPPTWQPAYPGVELPPAGSGTIVV